MVTNNIFEINSIIQMFCQNLFLINPNLTQFRGKDLGHKTAIRKLIFNVL